MLGPDDILWIYISLASLVAFPDLAILVFIKSGRFIRPARAMKRAVSPISGYALSVCSGAGFSAFTL